MTYDISAGIAWLDEHAKPGWRTAVAPDKIYMDSCIYCTLGTLARLGYFELPTEDELPEFGSVVKAYGLNIYEAARLGFERSLKDADPDAYVDLSVTWRKFFLAEREKATVEATS